MSRWQLALLVGLLSLCSLGCRSRWAMRDPAYAAKYPVHRDEPKQIVKQAIDARHLRGRDGVFVAGGGAPGGMAGFGEIGAFYYDRPTTETQVAFNTTYTIESPGLFLGLSGKRRVQLPSRGAPFVGVGGNVGLRASSILCLIFDDDDEDHFTFEDEETCSDHLDGMLDIYPEVGFHFWPNANKRWTVSAAYHVTTHGRSQDFLTFNVARSSLQIPGEPMPGEPGYDGWLQTGDDAPEIDRPAKWWWEEDDPWHGELTRLPPVMEEEIPSPPDP